MISRTSSRPANTKPASPAVSHRLGSIETVLTTKTAVIGAGLMGADRAETVVQDMPGTTLQVICDMDAGRAKSAADAYCAGDVGDVASRVATQAPVGTVICRDETGAGKWDAVPFNSPHSCR